MHYKPMCYSLEFDPRALKEWHKLGATAKAQFKKKLAAILANPIVAKNALTGLPNCYKIKLKAQGLRLVYQVIDDRLVVLVIAIGKRERQAVYHAANARLP